MGNVVANKTKLRISKRVFQEAKHAKISEKQTFLTPSYAQARVRIGNFGVLCFLEIPILRFALLPYYQQLAKIPSKMHSNLIILPEFPEENCEYITKR